MSGITDPYELYKHIHPSDVGTSLGSGMGGVTSMAKMFKDRRDERDVQNDILQETSVSCVQPVALPLLTFLPCPDLSTPQPAGSTFFCCHLVDLSRFQLEHGRFFPMTFICRLILCNSATALQSLEIACDSITSGKAKVMIAGGFDDISEEGSYEFANMKATSNAETEFAMGREPTEMSRPATTSRAGVRVSRDRKSVV